MAQGIPGLRLGNLWPESFQGQMIKTFINVKRVLKDFIINFYSIDAFIILLKMCY